MQDALTSLRQGALLSLLAGRFCHINFLLQDPNKLDWGVLFSIIFSNVDGWYGLLTFTNSGKQCISLHPSNASTCVTAPRMVHACRERIFIELMTSDRKLKVSKQGSK